MPFLFTFISYLMVSRVQSCGYAVPFYDFNSHRTQLSVWAAKRENVDRTADAPADGPFPESGLRAYWAESNAKSLDGLPAVLSAHKHLIKPKVGGSVSTAISTRKTSDGLKSFGFLDVKHFISFSVGVLVAVVCLRCTAFF